MRGPLGPAPFQPGKTQASWLRPEHLQKLAQQSNARKAAGSSGHSHEMAASAHSLMELWAAQPVKSTRYRTPSSGPVKAHISGTLHTKGARGGPLTHIPICRATESTSTSSKAGRGTMRITQPAATESTYKQQVGKSPPAPEALERYLEWPSKETDDRAVTPALISTPAKRYT